MKTRATLKPGAPGTSKLVAKYGKRLVRVRYRYDERLRRRYTTVELVEEEVSWERRGGWPDPDEVVEVRIGYEETGLRERIKAMGGWWSPGKRVWSLPRYRVVQLGLEQRIVKEGVHRE